MENSNNELDSLFVQYKAALPDPEASPNFMPELWRKIEARQSILFRIRRLTQVFVAAAAAISILFVAMLTVPSARPELNGSYLDALVQAYPTENLASHGIVHDSFEAGTR